MLNGLQNCHHEVHIICPSLQHLVLNLASVDFVFNRLHTPVLPNISQTLVLHLKKKASYILQYVNI